MRRTTLRTKAVVVNRLPAPCRNDPLDYNPSPWCGVALSVACATPRRSATKMNLIRHLLLLLSAILFTGCDSHDFAIGPGHSDFSSPLVGGYSLYRTSAHSVWITPGGYTDETPIIKEKVVECAVFGQFILAKRQGLKRRSPNDPKDTYEEPDPNVFDYWILDTSVPEVYGSFDIEGFEARKEQLGIDQSVILQPINSFRKEDAEQAGTGQPATRSQSKSEGSDKPQPESEGRSR